ncbi:hypothetical protein HY947_03145 [Candidatus Gottesmanbacteria bacterium]|nr:hypothetical protein [Candidatus Gottesmanbacteria bacterium]
MKKKYLTRGQALVEFLVASALAVLILPSLLTGLVSSRLGKAQTNQRLEATTLEKEAQDALRNIRDTSWSAISTNGTFHPTSSSSTWSLSPGSETVNGYTRSIIVADTYRDANGAIASSGTLDPSTKKITISVSWNTPVPSQASETLYLTRQKNLTYTQTTNIDFNAGTINKVTVTNVSGGEITLGSGGLADWCSPTLTLATLDLPKNGEANAISAIPGRIFAGTGENSSGVSFANINVTDTSPPTSQILGTFDGYKTNGVFDESNYAYLATDNNAKEVVIIDLTQQDPITKKYSEVGYFNAPGNGLGKSVFVSGNIGFVTDANMLYTFDLSSKTGSRSQLGSKQLTANGTKVVINGSYAFVSIAGATQELQIVQFSSDGKTLTIVGSADVNGQAANDVSVNASGTRAYLATGADPSKKEFFIIDTSSKTGNRPVIGSYEANGMNPKAVAIATANKAILVGTGGEEYQVINLTNETAPVRCGGIQVNDGINGIASVIEGDGDVYSYIITEESEEELKIIQGGPGGTYTNAGTFTSSIFDAGAPSAFNRFDVTQAVPNQTSIAYQVAGADAVGGNCASAVFSFVGPDGTSNTSYTNSGQIPFSTSGAYKNPARCFRYKVSLSSSDPSASPILYDFAVNYSP